MPEYQDLDYSLLGYDYELPPELIAQNPVVPRDNSRLLVVNPLKKSKEIANENFIFRNIPDFLQSGDLLVMNDTRVIPARLYGQKSTGAQIEVLLLQEFRFNCWLALVKPGKRFKIGSQVFFSPRGQEEPQVLPPEEKKVFEFPDYLTATVLDIDESTGGRLLEFDLPSNVSLLQVLDKFGEVPFPPYVTESKAQKEQYQTVYASNPGAVAAPTAGLHFTPELLDELQNKGINRAFITLHVGVGTFRPVEIEDVTQHQMHEEWISVPKATVEAIERTKSLGGRIIAVGTTAARALEGASSAGELKPFCGATDIFIYPGYQWKVVEGLITNFHLPRSSLMMMVSALIGRERLLDIYKEAIASRYRFYSFGDAMFILP
ncbi:MAG: tRNA preQ1(34) S-adenosylmethionine ribosyltransferase-isomerase QueA [Cyanobacteria bacterium P01_A01_bin.84]